MKIINRAAGNGRKLVKTAMNANVFLQVSQPTNTKLLLAVLQITL